MKLSPMIHGIVAVGCGALVLYALIVTLLYFRQTGMIHIPAARIVSTPAEYGLEYEDVWLETEDGARIHGWFIPHPAPRFTVILYHGNAGNISYLMETYEILHELRVSVLSYDYRTYGNSVGKLSEDAMYQDAEATLDYLASNRQIPEDKVVLLGRSLGSAMASWVAAERSPAGLIMETSFTSMADLARIHYKWIPASYLLNWHYDSLSRIGKVECPVLYIHSRQDTLTPFELGEKLYEATRSEKTFVEIYGTHDDAFINSRTKYVKGLDDFLNSLEQ